ncbi:unnamed protein product [Didymodactylos carnosus]|uniref:protein-tyrosine-phosphatase n=1 Tax=Didymodactylos carnosus TaxID=1234261 RepID=A0A8S2CXU5_9BILA|nr:unnamed protein product [Didymodactylos carnosus]CAF3582555.1 unnamed protein product [Didymodactylos carnosus]
MRIQLIRYRLDYSNGSCKGCQSALPSIVLDDFLFLGNLQNALNCELLEQLGIQHILNVCDFGLSEKIHQKFNVIEIPLMDAIHVDIKQHFDRTNTLLHSIYLKKERSGVSRSATIVLAYLMKYHHETLELAFSSLMVKRPQIFPNEGFLLQLVRYENELMKSKEIDQNEVSSHINSDDRQNAYDAIVDDKVDNNPIETLNEFKEKHDIHTTTTISNNEL